MVFGLPNLLALVKESQDLLTSGFSSTTVSLRERCRGCPPGKELRRSKTPETHEKPNTSVVTLETEVTVYRQKEVTDIKGGGYYCFKYNLIPCEITAEG